MNLNDPFLIKQSGGDVRNSHNNNKLKWLKTSLLFLHMAKHNLYQNRMQTCAPNLMAMKTAAAAASGDNPSQ
jgi:hypothetical protein